MKTKAVNYRDEAIACVKDTVLPMHRQIYARYDGDFDRIYAEAYDSRSYTGRVIGPGKVYELSYPECSCQSILYILSQLQPESNFDVQIVNTILRRGHRCTFRITKGAKRHIAFCGLDCTKCDAYMATKNDDQALRERTAKLWSELNHASILPEHIRCEGCRMDGAKTFYCSSLCEIRRCAAAKRIETCGDCAERDVCPKVNAIWQNNPQAKENLLRVISK